jgi:RND family efflux transporter MFP subunit
MQASRVRVGVVIILLAGGALGFGYWQHKKRAEPTAGAVSGGAVKVELITAKALQSDQAFALPGTVRPLEETKIYPRTVGYVRKYHADIGDKVAEGQLLAEIDTPELDAQLSQALAQLAQARAAVKQAIAQRDYSKSNAGRYTSLADQKLVAQQTVDQIRTQAHTDEALLAAAEANVNAQGANVRRLEDLKTFAKVVAPFAGTITTRAIAPGSLVGDPTNAAATGAMFTLVATDPVRVFLDVPQTVAPSVRPGTGATLLVREYPNHKFEGKVTRAAGALDPELHTMTTEVQVPNHDPAFALLPGMYVQVALTLPAPHRVLEIPSTALYSDAQGLRVATVDAGGRVKFVKITIERDTGATIQIATGLGGDERIIKVGVPTLVDGDVVELAK